MEEKWRDIPILKGRYQVSNFGRVRSLDHLVVRPQGNYLAKGRILKAKTNRKTKYKSLMYWEDGKQHYIYIHRLVAEAFIPNPDNLPFVNHKDENPSNNHIDNLEWCTHQYNCNYGTSKDRILEKIALAVYQMTRNGEIIATYKSIKDAARAVNSTSICISRACRGLALTANGYRWRYVDDRLNNIAQRVLGSRPQKKARVCPVLQYSLKGEFIARFDSMKDATIAICGKIDSNLSANLRKGEHIYKGFYFDYAYK